MEVIGFSDNEENGQSLQVSDPEKTQLEPSRSYAYLKLASFLR
jgi:hypothetical protein